MPTTTLLLAAPPAPLLLPARCDSSRVTFARTFPAQWHTTLAAVRGVAIKPLVHEPCEPAALPFVRATWKQSAQMPMPKLAGYSEAVQTLKAEADKQKQIKAQQERAKLCKVWQAKRDRINARVGSFGI